MRIKTLALAVAALFAGSAHAIEPFVIKEIRVEGVQRTEPGTVFNYLPVKVGDKLDDEKAAASIKALFATGFFQDVRLEADNDILIVDVDERPTIFQINIEGSKDFDKDQLKKALKDNGLAESRIFDRSLLDQAVQELKRQYFGRGKYSVEIKPTVTPLERNRVAINFDISEGVVATISQINVVGNQTFKESELLDLFSQSTGGWLSWFTKDNQYSKQKLSGDLENLRSFYLNRGYLEFNVDSTVVSISPDKKKIYITVNITEGRKYTVSDIRVGGDLLVSEEEVRKLIRIKPGDVFSREQVNESTTAISERLGNDGYAFANVNAVPELDREKQTVAFTFFLDPGRRVYVRNINITGNTKTRDEVVRREMRQIEGAWYNGAKIRRSKERVDLLGYFEDTNIETPQVPDSPDQVDVNVTVKEKPTGNVMAGVGYARGSGVTFQASISQSNIFGSGKYLALGFNTSKASKLYSLSYVDPYYTPDGVSRGFDLYYRKTDPNQLSLGQYNTAGAGGSMRFGLPLTEYDTLNFSVGIDRSELTLLSGASQRYVDFVNQFGSRYITLPLTASWVRDGRDSALYPTRGALHRIEALYAMPGGDLKYYTLSAQNQWFYPLSKTFTFMLNTEVGYADGYANKPLPFFKNLYAGGIGSVRGYANGTLGPKLCLTNETKETGCTGDPEGGNRKFLTNAEILFPIPGMKGDKSARLSVFADAGTVWAAGQKFSFGDMRYSAGIGLAWVSPVGPLKFSVAKPFNPKDNDKVERFQFQLGTLF
ncbi:outer membrane protein assembly factor BamA [Chitinivorax sp. B]|uniref:outer membrane protein assembly factor BamA n=1 Tax=Chitinivorax sp. B TaxID=2502235 RepID=UPI0010F69A89|nr:outer membrane protein assembly factor BamA [Chitinivorax sp. B]